MSIRSKIERDPFTERLLEVYQQLIVKDALGKKKHYTDAIKMTLTEFYQVEREMRNYPKDEIKRSQARINLLDKFGVNPNFITGKSKSMFIKEPEKVTKLRGQGNVTKVISTKQIQDYKIKIQELE